MEGRIGVGWTAETRWGDVSNMRGYSGHATSAVPCKERLSLQTWYENQGQWRQFVSIRVKLSDIQYFLPHHIICVIEFDTSHMSRIAVSVVQKGLYDT